mgnify:CR=1 FL=1
MRTPHTLIVPSNHPNGNDEILSVDGRKLRPHAEHRTGAAGNRAFVQDGKGPDQLAARVDRPLYLQGMKPAVALQHQVDLVAALVPIVPEQTVLAGVVVGL